MNLKHIVTCMKITCQFHNIIVWIIMIKIQGASHDPEDLKLWKQFEILRKEKISRHIFI